MVNAGSPFLKDTLLGAFQLGLHSVVITKPTSAICRTERDPVRGWLLNPFRRSPVLWDSGDGLRGPLPLC